MYRVKITYRDRDEDIKDSHMTSSEEVGFAIGHALIHTVGCNSDNERCMELARIARILEVSDESLIAKMKDQQSALAELDQIGISETRRKELHARL